MHGNFRKCAITLSSVVLGGVILPAHAQSDVTLYGIIDDGLLYTSKSLNPITRQNSGNQISVIGAPSLFGFKGSEDLGGGVKTIFDLESGFLSSTGALAVSNGNFFGRQAWVGVQGDFGTVKAGLQYSPFGLSLLATDARAVSFFGSMLPLYVQNVSVTGGFNPNALSYASPTIGGFQGSAMLALGGAAGDFQAGLEYSASLNYTYGPLLISAAMYNGNAGGSAATTPIQSTTAFTGRTIGATYEYGDLTVKAVFVNFKVVGSFDDRVYGGGFSYRFNPAVSADAGVWYTSDGNDTRNHSVLAATGVNYSLSKATLFYGQFGYIDNHGKMDTGMTTNGALFGATGSTLGVAVGIRHLF